MNIEMKEHIKILEKDNEMKEHIKTIKEKDDNAEDRRLDEHRDEETHQDPEKGQRDVVTLVWAESDTITSLKLSCSLLLCSVAGLTD